MPKFAKFARDRATIRRTKPNLVETGQRSSELRAKFDRPRTNFVDIGPMLDQFGETMVKATKVQGGFAQDVATQHKLYQKLRA